MKRIEYNGQSLVTGSAIAAAVTQYVTRASGMNSSLAVDIPVLAENGTVQFHTLILSAATQLDVIDVDGMSAEEEEQRFPMPDFPHVGGKAVPFSLEEMENSSPVLDEDPLNPLI